MIEAAIWKADAEEVHHFKFWGEKNNNNLKKHIIC